MSMDAITSAALESLQKNALPKLVKALTDLHLLRSDERAASPNLQTTISEATELLAIISKWLKSASSGKIPDISEEEGGYVVKSYFFQ